MVMHCFRSVVTIGTNYYLGVKIIKLFHVLHVQLIKIVFGDLIQEVFKYF